ncbi:hypothetical protein RHE_PD00011 (plasmid) [Rhizobium etli CFN 42]|jgi:hypothetical protein|uniref:Uncharacterized protein n=1 Tax=Rhizobium etli (strain ATCC 51251 / DSM 11541 / JCM 21823 / NBRC 15573 / CFN 42) TaxID=347834 RepID=Q8KKT8_RHIEC|nr:hypothetical protein RHE_PD00011 [Rhizobium etli CFN 42]PWI50902.1 hypothetical protein B5K03_28285 [Rhizobium phaseoli]
MRLSTLSFFARLPGQFPSIHYAIILAQTVNILATRRPRGSLNNGSLRTAASAPPTTWMVGIRNPAPKQTQSEVVVAALRPHSGRSGISALSPKPDIPAVSQGTIWDSLLVGRGLLLPMENQTSLLGTSDPLPFCKDDVRL